MANSDNKFVLRFIKNNIILNLSDYSKYKGYIHNFSQDNLKNNIFIVISNYNKLQSGLHSKYIFSNIDKT